MSDLQHKACIKYPWFWLPHLSEAHMGVDPNIQGPTMCSILLAAANWAQGLCINHHDTPSEIILQERVDSTGQYSTRRNAHTCSSIKLAPSAAAATAASTDATRRPNSNGPCCILRATTRGTPAAMPGKHQSHQVKSSSCCLVAVVLAALLGAHCTATQCNRSTMHCCCTCQLQSSCCQHVLQVSK